MRPSYLRPRRVPPESKPKAVGWTGWERLLIVLSLIMIAVPLYFEAVQWVSPVSVPAKVRRTATPTSTSIPVSERVNPLAPPEGSTAMPPLPAPPVPRRVNGYAAASRASRAPNKGPRTASSAADKCA